MATTRSSTHHGLREPHRGDGLAARGFTFAHWTFDAGRQRLESNGRSHPLNPKEASVLQHLAEAAPDLVSRDELMDRTWPHVVVGDHVLHEVIGRLRRLLEDDARHPRYIETLAKRGYRLMVPVQPAPVQPVPRCSPGRAAKRRPGFHGITGFRRTGVGLAALLLVALCVWMLRFDPASPGEPMGRSVAVLPFTAIGDAGDAEAYANGLSAELRARLASYPDLVTLAPSANARYRLEGSVQPQEPTVRVRIHLKRSSDGASVWSGTFEPRLDQAFAQQPGLAGAVVRAVRIQLAADLQCETVGRSSSSEAAAAYCAALAENYRINQLGAYEPQIELNAALRAIALDPSIADAYFLVANAWFWKAALGDSGWREAARLAHAALDQGLALDRHSPRMLFMRGVLHMLELDYARAEASFRRALAVEPLHPNANWSHAALGNVALRRGDVSRALENYRRAIRLDDSDGRIYREYAGVLFAAGEHPRAIEAADASLQLLSSGLWKLGAVEIKVRALAALGEGTRARAAVDEALSWVAPAHRFVLAPLLAAVGRAEEAQALLARAHDPHPDTMVMLFADLGDSERFFEWVHRAIDRRAGVTLSRLRVRHPVFAEMRLDPRWHAVMTHLEREEAEGRIQRARTSLASG